MRLLFLAFAIAATGCSSDPGTVIVEVRTDYRPEVDFASVQTELLGVRGPVTLDADVEDDFLSGLRVAELNEIEAGAHDLSVTLVSASGETVDGRRITIDVDGLTAITVEITSSGTDAGMDAGDASDSASDSASDAPRCETSELACADGLDDDCDGMTDCEDDDCSGATCDDGLYCNGVDVCESGGCNGHPGDPCAAPSTCDEDSDRCEGCSTVGCPGDEPGAWGACAGFPDTCAATGERSRPITQYTCVSDACVPSATTETETCMRADRDGVICGSTIVSDEPCMRTAECGTAGTVVRTTTTNSCMGESCVPSDTTSTVSCTLPAASDGTDCSSGYCCTGMCVAKNSNSHCGACGVSCAAGRSCAPAISNNGGRHSLPNAWVCTCVGFSDCRPSYGSGATCFDGHCQCFCSATAPTTCSGECSGGLCMKDTIEPQSDNFCGY